MRLNALILPAVMPVLLFCCAALAADPPAGRIDRLEYDFGQLSTKVDELDQRLAKLEAATRSVSIDEIASTYAPESTLGQKVAVPHSGTPWTYSGDDGTRESMIAHLKSANHRDAVMAWMGVDQIPEYEEELAKLSYRELKRLHSLDHNQATLTSTAKRVASTPAVTERSTSSAASSGHWETRRVGLFKRQNVWVSDSPSASSSRRVFSSGCPGGVCPLR